MGPVQLLLIDHGSKYSESIARSLGELGYRTAILPLEISRVWLTHNTVKGVIVITGEEVIGWQIAGYPPRTHLPEGLCQTRHPLSEIFSFGFSDNCYRLLFKPENYRTTPAKIALASFAGEICNARRDWDPKFIIDRIRSEIGKKTTRAGKESYALNFTGSHNSIILGALAKPILGEKLQLYCIDAGIKPENHFQNLKGQADAIQLRLKIFKMGEIFRIALAECDEDEKKERFLQTQIKAMQEAVSQIGAQYTLEQTLATDFDEIETSSNMRHGQKAGMTIELTKISPLQNLFPHEVRALAPTLGLFTPIEIPDKPT